MSLVYFTSDPHLGHELAARLRGFDSVEEHDTAVLKSYSKLTKRDTLFILGDVSMVKDSICLFALLKCATKLLLGNHDPWPAKHYLAFFDDIIGPRDYKHFWISHFPIHPQEIFRRKGNIHGHIHRQVSRDVLERVNYHTQLPMPPYFNVCWDWHRGPVLFTDIVKALEDGDDDV